MLMMGTWAVLTEHPLRKAIAWESACFPGEKPSGRCGGGGNTIRATRYKRFVLGTLVETAVQDTAWSFQSTNFLIEEELRYNFGRSNVKTRVLHTK